ncbi:MAG: translation initiation factor IF-3 [Gammaproteobacteria bacterium]|nr:translation initiation factor IF-3 [Gammaproteobacteria bacterium]
MFEPNIQLRGEGISKASAVSRSQRPALNEEIDALQVRLIDKEGNQVGVIPRSRALEVARDDGLDLVMIAPNASPPVVKILDYSKHAFERKKQINANKKRQKGTQLKEIWLRPNTREGDYNIKIRSVERFLAEGDKAKITLKFRGREVLHPEIGMEMLDKVEKDLAEIATVEMRPKVEGKQMVMILAPLSKKGKAQQANAKA